MLGLLETEVTLLRRLTARLGGALGDDGVAVKRLSRRRNGMDHMPPSRYKDEKGYQQGTIVFLVRYAGNTKSLFREAAVTVASVAVASITTTGHGGVGRDRTASVTVPPVTMPLAEMSLAVAVCPLICA